MSVPPDRAHSDNLDSAVEHFNASFRLRYRLEPVTVALISAIADLDWEAFDFDLVRADGVDDASCALIAKIAIAHTPRYGIGLLTASGDVTVLLPHSDDTTAYAGHVLLVILGGVNNWAAASRWMREVSSAKARRTELGGLASEHRPDEEANWALLRAAAAAGRPAIALPPDEGFSARRAAEVSFIF